MNKADRFLTKNNVLIHAIAFSVVVVGLVACATQDAGNSRAEEYRPGLPTNDAPNRKMLTAQECRDGGGRLVGDPGDGRTHRPDFCCPNGQPPLGGVSFGPGEAIPIEGAVCCSR